MSVVRTVKVEYPDGTTRDIEPASWEMREGLPPRPVFNPATYDVVETCTGRYIAIPNREN